MTRNEDRDTEDLPKLSTYQLYTFVLLVRSMLIYNKLQAIIEDTTQNEDRGDTVDSPKFFMYQLCTFALHFISPFNANI